MSNKVLQLALKGEYFDAIKNGTKEEEYRLATGFWHKRLHNKDGSPKKFDKIVLTRGYPRRDDLDKRIELPWVGFVKKVILHPHFGPTEVDVYAIDVSGLVY